MPQAKSQTVLSENYKPYKERKRGRQPTIKQIKALQNIKQGMSVRGSMIKAGYSIKQANKSTQFFKKPGVQKALESQLIYLDKYGLTHDKYAQKLAEFVDAKKIVTSLSGDVVAETQDYRTQIEGMKLWNGVLERHQVGGQKKKREMTITEFVNEEEDAR